jgi:hypothetical protein
MFEVVWSAVIYAVERFVFVLRMSFAFIPRSVKKKNHPSVPVSNHALLESISVGAHVTSESVDKFRETKPPSSSESVKKQVKIGDDDEHPSTSVAETKPTTATSIAVRKDLFDLEDLAQLVCLALSDYAVWADADLQRKIDWRNTEDDFNGDTELIPCISADNNGCTSLHIICFYSQKVLYSLFLDIPLAYIVRHSQVFRLVSSSSSIINQPQTTFIKAIRTHASHLIDVRLIIPPSSSSTFPRNNTAQWAMPHIQTGYELRRKETSSVLGKHGKKEWDALTIYVVCSTYFGDSIISL